MLVKIPGAVHISGVTATIRQTWVDPGDVVTVEDPGPSGGPRNFSVVSLRNGSHLYSTSAADEIAAVLNGAHLDVSAFPEGSMAWAFAQVLAGKVLVHPSKPRGPIRLDGNIIVNGFGNPVLPEAQHGWHIAEGGES